MQDGRCSSTANTRRERIKVAALLLFCCKRYSPKGCFGELFEDKNRSGKQGAFTILLIAYIGSKSTPPYLPVVKKYSLRFLVEHSFFLMPFFKILFHGCSNVSTSIIFTFRDPSTMAEFAARGKTSVDWFYGFKLHLVINDEGELLGVKITAGNIDDRGPVPELARALFGKLFGDRGYISQALFEQLWQQGVQLITKLRKNMKNKLLPLFDKLLLRKRSLVETINDQLKNISQIEHSRHRSPFNFFVNLIAGLVAYTFREKKPSLNIRLPQALPAVVL